MRDLTYPPIIVTAQLAFKALGLRFDMRGTENVPRRGGALLALNHISYVDFILGGYAAHPSRRLVRFMSKRELFDHRWTGPLMRSLHHISVDRADGLASYAEGVRYLREGEVVGIFPEATISRSFELKAEMARLLDETIKTYPADEQPPGSWWLPASYGGSAPTMEEAARLDAEEKRERARARAAKRKAKQR